MIPGETEPVNTPRLARIPRFQPMARSISDRARRHRGVAGLVLAALLAWAGPAAAGQIVVVAHPGLPVKTLSAEDIKAIYIGQLTFVAGTKVYPVDYALTDGVSESFLRTVVGMSPERFQTYWIKEVFHSGRVPPRKVVNADEVLRMVAADPGAIGYVPAEALKGVTSVKRLFAVTVP
jgi:hypothetical protein